jgi:hypothetical protein
MIGAIHNTHCVETQCVAQPSTHPSALTLPEPTAEGMACCGPIDLAEALARLVAQSAAEQRNADKAERKLLRDQQYRKEDAQVSALRNKASCIEQGAVTSGVSSIASGACGVGSAVCGAGAAGSSSEPSSTTGACLGQASGAFGRLSQPLGQLVGDSRAAGAEADAKAAELAAQRAKDQASDAADHAQQMASLAQEAMAAIKSLDSIHNEAIQAILRRM